MSSVSHRRGNSSAPNQVLNTKNLDYGMQLLLNCCLIDPANPTYRQALRQAQKAKYQNNLKGQNLALLTSLRARLRMKTALRKRNHLLVLEHAEQVLMRNPWDKGAHLAMAEAFENLELTGLAIWTLDQIRQVDGANPKITRPLARLFEKTGNFTAATSMWELVRKADPSDLEAQHKYKDLAASATIAKGRYQDAIDGTAPTPMATAAAESALEEPAGDQSGSAMPRPRPAPAGPPRENAPRREERVPREVAALQAKIEANPTNANTYLHLAAIYRRADQWDQARQVLLGGLGPTANSFEIAMELADLEIEPFRRDLAVAEEKLSRQPGNQELQAIRASLAKEIATRELDFFRQKADRFPTEIVHRFEMGVRLFHCGQVDEAIRELQAAPGPALPGESPCLPRLLLPEPQQLAPGPA